MIRGTMGRIFAATFLLLMLAACASSDDGPSQAELRSRWDAQNVYPQRYREEIVAFMHTYLNDPVGVRSAAVTQPRLKQVPGNPGERYLVCLRYSARGQGGAYGSAKDAVVTFVSGRFERFIDPQRGDLPPEAAFRIIRDLCKDTPYDAFPELQQLKR